MQLSLSVRIAEEFLSKEKASMDLASLAELAAAAGYSSLCMRASQVGIHSPAEVVIQASELLRTRGLSVSMVSGDFDIVYNNEAGPNCLRLIKPYLDLAAALHAPMIRVALKTTEDIPWARRAADEAAERGVKLVHQCHTQSLFETIEGIEQTLRRIDRANFGLVYEPANLELCNQDYGQGTIRRLAPWIFNVYFQNQIVRPDGALSLPTWCRGPVRFDLIPIPQPGGIDFARVLDGLAAIGYRGPVTVHQAQIKNEPVAETIRGTATYLNELARRTRFDVSHA